MAVILGWCRSFWVENIYLALTIAFEGDRCL